MRIERWLGVARSLAVYHAIPGRQRRLRRLYSSFVREGDVAFDIGAHVGNRTRALAALGCRVVAIEPQADLAGIVRFVSGRSARVDVLEQLVSAVPGKQTLWICDAHPTVATSAAAWRDERAKEEGFSGVEWKRAVEVDATTLDELIARYGMPRFVKIDVEGGEPAVLAGLRRAVPVVSFEYLPAALAQVEHCARRLLQLGDYAFNWSRGETFCLASNEWMPVDALLRALTSNEAQRQSGDVYAKLL